MHARGCLDPTLGGMVQTVCHVPPLRGKRTYPSNVPLIPCSNPVWRDQSQTSLQFPRYAQEASRPSTAWENWQL
jgi:hypothetical protein